MRKEHESARPSSAFALRGKPFPVTHKLMTFESVIIRCAGVTRMGEAGSDLIFDNQQWALLIFEQNVAVASVRLV